MHLSNILNWPSWQIEGINHCSSTINVFAKSLVSSGRCPDCGFDSSKIHSYYSRQVSDLPLCEKSLVIHLRVKRFRCSNPICLRKTFVERNEEFLPLYSRRTKRLSKRLYFLGLSLGGKKCTQLLPHLGMSGSRDTVLRNLRREFKFISPSNLKVIGIDDWAWRKRVSYGSIIVDLERHKVIDLLPDRAPETISKWLQEQKDLEMISRDRGNEMIDGINQGAPQAIQIADRFHLLQNLTTTIFKEIEQKPRIIKNIYREKTECNDEIATESAGSPSQEEDETTPADKRRFLRIQRAQKLHDAGWTARKIAKELGLSPKTINRYLKIEDPQPAKRNRKGRLLDPYKSYLIQRWHAGCQNGSKLLIEIQGLGYQGKATILREFLKSLKIAKEHGIDSESEMAQKWKKHSLRRLAFMMGRPEEEWNEKPWFLKGIELLRNHRPEIGEMIDLARQFTVIVSERLLNEFENWLEKARKSASKSFQSFAKSLESDLEAVKAALTLTWSNGPVEGKINRLKLLKREMYGRANLDLLKIRLIGSQTI